MDADSKNPEEKPDEGKTSVELTHEFIKRTDARLKMLERWLWIRWVVTIVGLVIAFAGLAFATSKAINAADNAKTVSSQNKHLISDIGRLARNTHQQATNEQIQRHTAALTNCRDQNSRNRNTISRLKRVTDLDVKIGLIPKSRAKANLEQTKFLIGALQPYRNCQKIADRVAPLPGSKTQKKKNLP